MHYWDTCWCVTEIMFHVIQWWLFAFRKFQFCMVVAFLNELIISVKRSPNNSVLTCVCGQNTGGLRTSMMVIIALCVVLPLGLLRDLHSLSNVSAISLGFYMVFVAEVSLIIMMIVTNSQFNNSLPIIKSLTKMINLKSKLKLKSQLSSE